MQPGEPDIKAVWAAIADREARLLTLVRASAQIVWVTDKQGHVLSDVDPPPEIADLTWSTFTGLSQENLRGSGWAAAVHPDDLQTIATTAVQVRDSGAPIDCEFRIRHKSGEWRWVICRGVAVRADSGEIVGWVGSCTDISAARKTEAAYREAQQRLLAALDAGEMSTWIWNLADNTFWWDDAGPKLWGVVEEPTNHDIGSLMSLIHAEDLDAVMQAQKATLATGVAHSVEFRTVRPDGKLQWLQTRGRVEKDASGVAAQVIGAFIDVTKIKTAEESLRQAQKMEALGTLAGGIAHDFNNLLLAISGNTQLVLDDLDAKHPSRRSLEEIGKAAARAGDLVRRILTFSARQPSSPAVTPLRPAVEEALTLLRSSVPQNIRIGTRFDGVIACTLGHVELEQVIVNLVNNAIQAIGDRPGSIDIEVAVEHDAAARPANLPQSGRYARLTIRDSGSGMDAATRARVFEPFFTTKPSGKGTGLGLAVVHGIVQGCGGAITVESHPGRGSTFKLWLPLAATPAAASQPAATQRSAAGRGERILYVDDDEAVNFLIQRLLGKSGYLVTCCEDPHDALRLFAGRANDFDVVVTDLSMPGMNGFDLAEKLRLIRSDIQIVMTSGYVRDDDQACASRLGLGRIILKPNTVDELGRELDARCAQLRSNRMLKASG